MSFALDSRSSPPAPQIQILNQVIFVLIIPGLGLTAVLLTLYGYAAWNPISRRYLDRVSFRLLTYALVADLSFGILFTIGSRTASPGRRCAILSFLGNSSLVFSAGMFFSIAINLPLVLAFNVNGRKMEKYYVIGIMLIGLLSNVVPYVSGSLKWNDMNKTCWYHTRDPSALLHWLVGAQTIWILLASLGEVVAFMIIAGYLVAYRLIPEDIPATYSSTPSPRPGSTIMKFRNIILRIGLYPLASCILNISTAVIEFYLFQNHRKNLELSPQQNWRLALAGLTMYVGRPLVYGLFAATDPVCFINSRRSIFLPPLPRRHLGYLSLISINVQSFIRALRALRHPQNESERPSQIHTRGPEMSTIIYLPQEEISINDRYKHDTPGSSSEAQSRRGEGFAVSIPGTNSEMGKVPPLGDANGTPAPIDVVSQI
ncbi:hypothetical protein C8R45DRAFT_1192538 [Mycena sanguinolenta]|nr:hypothetical protein C8R45DRAFT_1192538 [Mycena sanguinolenta]